MVKTTTIGIVFIFLALILVSVIFIANIDGMTSEYTENSTLAEAGERGFGLFSTISFFIIPMGLILIAVLIILAIKYAATQGRGCY